MTPEVRLSTLESTVKALAEGFDHLRASLSAAQLAAQTRSDGASMTDFDVDARLAAISRAQDDLAAQFRSFQDDLAHEMAVLKRKLSELSDQNESILCQARRDRYEITRALVIQILREVNSEGQQ